MNAKWKTIVGFNYSVSQSGQIRNDKTGQIFKPWKNRNGYAGVTLWKNGTPTKQFVHRLVAQAFIPNPENLPFIDHINTNPHDNSAENLRWVTPKGNSNNSITLQKLYRTTFKSGDLNLKTMTGKFGKDNPVSRPVIQLKDGEVIAYHECARRAMYATGVNCTSITKVCKGKRKSAGGYQWQYNNEI